MVRIGNSLECEVSGCDDARVVVVSEDRLVVEWAARLRTAVARLERQFRRETSGPYTPTQLSVIGAIYRYGPIPLGELASRERLSPPSISQVVATLEEVRIVERIPDPADRRVCRVAITAAGNRWIEANRVRRNEWLAERIAMLSPPERAAIATAVPVLERLLGEDD
jgi:DNA-binding MarR family transcriptional regulator